ncbi:39S ribosomal protein L12, mitochondrial [Pseudomyrmex gracilis]|uniref:39S ribosomal protein L12, mitochondrial n=1 Tax=Pseudomyrmex gracilis TaxID=219809 RepID=UPI000995BF95|nr:39S ribosomal protein L12, mitochondrial [Pseudomyrmex gracilis]
MINTFRLISRQKLYQFQFPKCIAQQAESSSVAATQAASAPLSLTGVDKPVNLKIDKLVNDITALNLIEVAELSDLLKKRLNLPDAPVMPVGGTFVAPAQLVEEEQIPKKVKTEFTVKITEINKDQKVSLIKEVKNLIPGSNLVQAKKFIEELPAIIRKDVAKDEAEKVKDVLVKLGAKVEIE